MRYSISSDLVSLGVARQLESEGRACADFCFDPQPPTHRHGKAVGDGQAQPHAAAVFAFPEFRREKGEDSVVVHCQITRQGLNSCP